jgi:deoxyribonuclease V
LSPLTLPWRTNSFGWMKYQRLHSWRVSPREAAQIQTRLRGRLELVDRLPVIRHVAGADLAFNLDEDCAIAGVVVYRFPEMEEIERKWGDSRIAFPYVPGLLSFREGPALLKVFARLKNKPDLIFCDGHGYAHPRRFGVASHLGLLLDTPTIGCAKSILIGTYERLPLEAGAWAPLRDRDEVIGAALRTRTGVNPIYVTQGHRVSLATALKFTLAVGDGYRIPRPTRDADHFVAAVKRGEYATSDGTRQVLPRRQAEVNGRKHGVPRRARAPR